MSPGMPVQEPSEREVKDKITEKLLHLSTRITYKIVTVAVLSIVLINNN